MSAGHVDGIIRRGRDNKYVQLSDTFIARGRDKTYTEQRVSTEQGDEIFGGQAKDRC